MKLELAIKQSKPFKNEREKAVVNIVFTHGWLNSEMKSFFKLFGITSKQYNILRILKGADKPVSTSFIRERLVEKLSDVSRIVDRMHSKGLVIKKGCEKDRRLVDVKISSQGLSVIKKIDKENYKIDNLFDNLSEKEIKTLNVILDKLRD